VAEETDASVVCRHCKSPMEPIRRKKYSKRWAVGLVLGGVFCCLFFIGALVGIPMLLVGIYMAMAEETINHCSSCGYYYEVWSEEKMSG